MLTIPPRTHFVLAYIVFLHSDTHNHLLLAFDHAVALAVASGSTAVAMENQWTFPLAAIAGGDCSICMMSGMWRFCCCIINPRPTPVRSGTTPSPVAMPMSTKAGILCPKCGTIKKSGKRNCCTRGGAWFKKCGDDGDATFDHTWSQGFQACESRFLRG